MRDGGEPAPSPARLHRLEEEEHLVELHLGGIVREDAMDPELAVRMLGRGPPGDLGERLHHLHQAEHRTGGDRVYISAGLDEGDLVALTMLDNSFAGAEVTIVSSTPSDRLDEQGKVRTSPELTRIDPVMEPGSATAAGGR